MLTRTAFAAALLTLILLPTEALPQSKPASASPTDPTVLFVCEHGAAKSVIATAYFNKMAKEKGLPYRAISRATHPDAAVSPKVAAALKAEGFNETQANPQAVTDKDVAAAGRIVTLGCKLPQKAAVTDWSDVPAVSEDYAAASQAIHRHVEDLLTELAAKDRAARKQK